MKKVAILVIMVICALCAAEVSLARDVEFFQLAIPTDAEFIHVPAAGGIPSWDVAAAKIERKPGIIFILEFAKEMKTGQLVASPSVGSKTVSWAYNNKMALAEFTLQEGEVEVGPAGNTRKFLVTAQGITLKK